MYKKISLFILLIVLLFACNLNINAADTPTPESIFGSDIQINEANLGVTGSHGTLFGVKKEGKITAVKRFIVNPGIHKVSLWETDSSGSETGAIKLAGIYDWDVTSGNTGWQTFNLPEEVNVYPGKYYVVSISTSVSVNPSSDTNFSYTSIDYFTQRNSASSNIITYINSSRQYNAGDGTIFPALQNDAFAFGIDIVYTPNPTPDTEKVPYIADQTWVPSLAQGGGGAWNYGTEFQVLKEGKITKIRVFEKAGASGNVYASIWNKDTQQRLTPEIQWNIGNVDSDGWIEYTLDQSLSVVPGVNYVVSVSTCTEGNTINDFVYFDNILGSMYNYNSSNFKEVYGVFSQDRNSIPSVPSLEGKRYFFRDVVFTPTAEPQSNPETGDSGLPVYIMLSVLSMAVVALKVKKIKNND